MDERVLQLETFFQNYCERFNQALNGNTPEVEETAAMFSDCMVEATPAGVICGKNDAVFREMIPKGYKFYRSIGITSMSITAKEITLLDEYHAMTKVHWKSDFIRKDQTRGAIEFTVIYFLQTKDNQIKIFAYITGDEQRSLKENGLL